MVTLPEELRDGRIGRFPVWAIGVVLAGGIVLFMFWRNRSSRPATDAEPLYYETADGLPPGSAGDFLAGDPLDPAYPVGLPPQGLPGPLTNVQWTRLAFDYLIGQGNDPELVERALAKYISGQALTVAEQAVVNLAHRVFGAPPEGLILLPPGIPPKPRAPAPTPPQRKPPRRYVIVRRYQKTNTPWESTLSGIAQHYGVTVEQLKNVNHLKSNVIYTGQKIWIDPE